MKPFTLYYVRRVRRPLLAQASLDAPQAESRQADCVNEVPGGAPGTTRETVAAPLANVLPEEANNASDPSNAGAE